MGDRILWAELPVGLYQGLPVNRNAKQINSQIKKSELSFGLHIDQGLSVKYRFQGTFYCPKSSKKCVCT